MTFGQISTRQDSERYGNKAARACQLSTYQLRSSDKSCTTEVIGDCRIDRLSACVLSVGQQIQYDSRIEVVMS